MTMPQSLVFRSPAERWMLYSARFLVLAWALFWIWFGLASGVGEGLNATGVLIHGALPGLIFLTLALLAWRWHHVGAFLLVAASLAIAVGYPILAQRFPASTILLVVLTMAVPPFVAGLLFWREAHRR
jgi:hypothetical protein